MTAYIDHGDTLDVRDLADTAAEQGEILADTDADEDSREDALDTLKALAGLLTDLGIPVDATSAEEVADALRGIADRSSPSLIADHHFVEAMEDDFNDMYGLRDGLPAYLVVDWDATAANLKADYSKVTLDGTEYYIRRG